MRGLSQRTVAAGMEPPISNTAISKYEKGLMLPTSTVLIALSNFFGVRPDFFFEPQPVTLGNIEFRKNASLGRQVQHSIVHKAQEFFERYIEVEAILDFPRQQIPQFDLTACAPEDLREKVVDAARKLREQWGLGRQPIASVHEMLEDHGVMVYDVDAGDAKFSGLAGWAGETPVIVLAKSLDSDLPRKRFTALHELGHLVMSLPTDLEKNVAERLSHLFAGEMLIPKDRFFAELGRERPFGVSVGELVAVKAQWGISMAAIMYRAKDLGVISDGGHRAFCIKYNRQKWASGEPGSWSGSEQSGRFRQLVHRAAASQLISVSKAAGLLGVSVRDFEREAVYAG